MSRQKFTQRTTGVVVVIVAGLGLGFVAARDWRVGASLPVEAPAKLVVASPAQEPAGRTLDAKSEPAPPGHAVTRRALLVGVTKYDHLPRDRNLDGPSHDARLMGRLLRERYQFPAEGIVTLTEDEGSPARRPTRANIEREFRRLADQAREGDQVVVLLAGHGARQPESNPPDPAYPEPDGIDEIFLPADVSPWKGERERVPNAIVDNEIGAWLRAITAKRAYVWAIFDCCHSGTMTRGIEVVRELPPEHARAAGGDGKGSRAGGSAAGEDARRVDGEARPVRAAGAFRLPGCDLRLSVERVDAREPCSRRSPQMPRLTGCSPTAWWISSTSRRSRRPR